MRGIKSGDGGSFCEDLNYINTLENYDPDDCKDMLDDRPFRELRMRGRCKNHRLSPWLKGRSGCRIKGSMMPVKPRSLELL